MGYFVQKFGWLRRHALTLVLAVVYVFMSLLVFEQGRTIESQRQLIRALFQDSLKLNQMKARAEARQR